jgi:ABC-type antimicrobial peptide transport system permease subunit
MNNLVEILLGILLILLVVGEPKFLVRFTKSGLGKLVFLVALIFSSMKSLTAGVLVFLIYVVLRRDFTLVEGMENGTSSTQTTTSSSNGSDSDSDSESDSESDNESDNESDSDSDTDNKNNEQVNIKVNKGVDMSKSNFINKYCKNGNVDSSLNPPPLKYTNGKCNPCDDDCGFEVTSAVEQLTIDEAMRPKESNSIPVTKN